MAREQCDLVMKGGVTSGIIYPRAIAAIARDYDLRSVGGASAGAIAAIAAVAAQYRRETTGSDEGFEALDALPAELGAVDPRTGLSRLLSLFDATGEGAPFFSLALGWLAGGRRRVWATLRFLVRTAPPVWAGWLLASAALWASGPALHALLGTLGLLVVAVGLCGYVALQELREALSEAQGFGLCSGYRLSEWMHELVNRLAGRPLDQPLTCGDLSAVGLDLQVMTTNVTVGVPERLPLLTADRYWFRLKDLQRLFPPAVVAAVMRDQTVEGEGEDARVRFPVPERLPVVVAARMSLSFPLLLQAVPLYSVDYTRSSERDRVPEVCWFSDGGLCANLPLHFFDALVPSRPTFALNLKPPHPDHPVPERIEEQGDQSAYVYMAASNRAGVSLQWNRFTGVGGFLGRVLDTMQGWNETATAPYPGYRDRIAHISHNDQEGGLNLEMDEQRIEALAKRGAAAGELVVQRFRHGNPNYRGQTGWQNQQWVRYRALLAMLAAESGALESLSRLEALFESPPSYDFVAERRADDDGPTQKERVQRRKQAREVNRLLVSLTRQLRDAREAVEGGVPRPRAELKARPRV